MSDSRGPMDPVLLEVLWNRLISIVNEQAAALMHASFTTVVREAGDLSAGIFDRGGNMLAQAVTGTPGHINTMATGVRHFVRAHPIDSLEPGDSLLTNDPWMVSGHLHDITVVTPVFHGGRGIGWFANTCHAMDIGGRTLGADAREVFEEGLAIPIMKLFNARGGSTRTWCASCGPTCASPTRWWATSTPSRRATTWAPPSSPT